MNLFIITPAPTIVQVIVYTNPHFLKHYGFCGKQFHKNKELHII